MSGGFSHNEHRPFPRGCLFGARYEGVQRANPSHDDRQATSLSSGQMFRLANYAAPHTHTLASVSPRPRRGCKRAKGQGPGSGLKNQAFGVAQSLPMQSTPSLLATLDFSVLSRDLSNPTTKGVPMRIGKIKKGGGRFRTIYFPSAKEKRKLRDLLPLLNEIHAKAVDAAGTRGVAHAFVANRNPVTCALPHRGFQVTVSCDMENWFDTVRENQLVAAGVPPDVAKAITIDGACRQGLPTSPVAANIAAVKFDKILLMFLNRQFKDFAYTRYADDVIVSVTYLTFDGQTNCVGNDGMEVFRICESIRCAAKCFAWKVNESKTRAQYKKAGRRIIVGIAVDDRVQETRKTRRKLRAALHTRTNTKSDVDRAAATQSAAGLAEWAACKLPRRVRSTRQMMGVLAGSGPVAASTQQTPTVAITGSGRRVLVPVREKIADDSANE